MISQNSGTHFIYNYWFITKDMIKETNAQPSEETHRVRSRRVLATEASALWSWGAPPSWHMDVFTNLGAPESPLLRLLWKLPYIDMISY